MSGRRYANQIDGCQIWPEHEGTGYFDTSGYVITVENSPRAGGKYRIERSAKIVLDSDNVSDEERARLTTMLVDQRQQGIGWPTVTVNMVEIARSKSPLLAQQRAIRLLRFMSEKADTIASFVSFNTQSDDAYAWTESIQWNEIAYLIQYAETMGWLQGDQYIGGSFQGRLTIDGYDLVAELRTNVDSSQAFVAMWFDDTMKDAFDKGIKPAICDAGFRPMKIDQKEHINKIDDEIIAEIRRSRFVVADFTQGEDGARGGVYYEAGFARGLDIPVISTCRDDSMKEVHFDTNHYNHIVWKTPEELREKLKNRILAVIGEGPGRRAI